MIRSEAKLLVLAAVLLVVGVSPGAAGETGSAAGVQRLGSFESQVVAQLNALRAGHRLKPLRLSRKLSAASAQHSAEMARRGYFAHESADGSDVGERVERYYPPGNYLYWSVGENLLYSSPSITPKAALELWLESPGHREILLSRDWREIGIAAVHADSAPGFYGGNEVTILTADFGVRR